MVSVVLYVPHDHSRFFSARRGPLTRPPPLLRLSSPRYHFSILSLSSFLSPPRRCRARDVYHPRVAPPVVFARRRAFPLLFSLPCFLHTIPDALRGRAHAHPLAPILSLRLCARLSARTHPSTRLYPLTCIRVARAMQRPAALLRPSRLA